jgi:hypothetical protein
MGNGSAAEMKQALILTVNPYWTLASKIKQ